MKDESDLDSVNSAESSNGFRNSDEETPSLGAYNRDYDDNDDDEENDDDMDHSGDENDEDQDISSQEGDNVSRNDEEGEDEDQEHSDKNDSDDDDDDDDGDDDDDDESMDEEIAMHTSRGKSLEHSYADSDTDDSDNDDERDEDEDDNNNESTFDTPSKDNDQDDEDMDTEDADQNEETPLEDDHSPIDDSIAETSAVIATPLHDESTEHTPGTGVSDVVAVAVESASEPSEQVEVVVAAVVPKKAKRKTPSSTKKRAVSPKKSKTSKKKGAGGRRKRSDSDLSTNSNAISRDRLEAAQQARIFLIQSVNQTPFAISDSHVIQNFGRIKVEDPENPLFSNPTSLYPVGFACDRYEFSPVHGRLLKMRCEILDGSKFKEGLNTEPGNEENDVKPKRHDGPLFRISWGQGIDELDEGSPFPFEVYSSCTPMTNEVDTVAVPLGFHSNSTKPEKGMRVKVRVDKYSWYRGTIMWAKNTEDEKDDDDSSKRKSSKKKKQTFHIKIAYDDGLTEDTIFPDPDISLVAPGSEGITGDDELIVEHIKGIPVTCVVGTTPIEAWANALIKLGLIDEIMYERSLDSIAENRAQGIAEVEGRMETLRNQRREARARQVMKQKGVLSDVKDNKVPSALDGEESKEDSLVKVEDSINADDEPKGEKTDTENVLEQKFNELLEEYQKRLEAAQKVTIDLANRRIEALGPFLMNPFYDYDLSVHQQKNWLTTVVKKEKSKMGSTGNKRKIVTPTDILDRNANFYNSDIERLLEGLPGTEYCSDYIFHQMRGAGATTYTILHDFKLRKEKEKQTKKRRAKEKEKKLSLDKEKQKKRKRIEDEKSSKKQAKHDEVDQVKQARKEERLSKLSGQIEERLFKEACVQRERVVLLASKLLQKELFRRQKTAEVLSGHVADKENLLDAFSAVKEEIDELPPLAEEFDLTLVKVHDFLNTYADYFKDRGLSQLPSLTELRDAISVASSNVPVTQKREQILLLNEIATAFCKPLAPALLKMLSSALTTSLQEKKSDDDPDELVVNTYTWREIARLFFLSEVLNELGLTRVEQTHVLRGYRSGGHPNSKEAKRIRRGEDSALVLRRQDLIETAVNGEDVSNDSIDFKVVLPVPCNPTTDPSKWTFFLHNIKALPSNAATGMKSNLRKACSLLKAESNLNEKSYITELESQIDHLDQIGTSITSSTETMEVCKNVKNSILRILYEVTGESFSDNKVKRIIKEKDSSTLDSSCISCVKPHIYRGTIDDISVTKSEYKKFTQAKEAYMVAAIRFKEEQERQKSRDNSQEDDDDDDEDDDDDVEMKVVANGEDANDAQDHDGSPEESNIEKERRTAQIDEFCSDDPCAPELIRRCLAVLRNLCHSSPAEAFLYPVDPQTNMKYYESVLRPMSLYDVGKSLQAFARKVAEYGASEEDIESTVVQFARDVRLIGQNATCFSNPGGPLISTAEELLRVFERLLFDWVLAPPHLLPAVDMLDDEKCVTFDESDEDSMILICDGCEGKYNMSLLRPKLFSVPKSDWYCPRCRSRYSWSSVDPRLDLRIKRLIHGIEKNGKIKECILGAPRLDAKKSLFYRILYDDGTEEILSLQEVDDILHSMGNNIQPIRCLDAVVESPGYGCGTDYGLVVEVLPVLLNPRISDAAAQKFIESTYFQDIILSSACLLSAPTDALSSFEWLRLLSQLSLKCMASDALQEFASKLESSAEEALVSKSSAISKIKSIADILPKVSEDEGCNHVDTDSQNDDPSRLSAECIPSEIVTAKSGDESDAKLPEVMDPELDQANHAVKAAKKRQKKRDDAFLCTAIKAQVKSAVSSMEEDNITAVINHAFSKEVRGLDIASIKCPGDLCHFCGLSDSALGTPLVRFLNEKEWAERYDALCSNKRSELIAAINISNDQDEEIVNNKQKYCAVTLRVSGDIITDDETFLGRCTDYSDLLSCGLVPKHDKGFQYELKSRASDCLPVITGSIFAHECCAMTAHRVRVEKKVQKVKERMLLELERAQANSCGRTLSIGTDSLGRSYWRFDSNPECLFVLVNRNNKKVFFRYDTPESIASVIVSLQNKKPSKDLQKMFPAASEMIQTKEWADILQKRALAKNGVEGVSPKEEQQEIQADNVNDDGSTGTHLIFENGDDVLVQSASGSMLWDATILTVATTEDDEVVSYRVHYKEWSSRFDEWVHRSRVLEMNDDNLELQQRQSLQPCAKNLPEFLQTLIASSYIDAEKRLRSFAYQPDFNSILKTSQGATMEEIALAEMKAAILLIEAAMPYGSMKAIWKSDSASTWRQMVRESTTSGNLMGCVVLFENSILKDWIRPNGEHLFASLPRPWKAINESSIASVALRIWTLDSSLKYATTRGSSGGGGEAWDERGDSF